MVIPVMYPYHFNIPQIPDEDFRFHESVRKRIDTFYEKYPHGYIEILPSLDDCYVWRNCNVFNVMCQIIRTNPKGEKILIGDYDESVVFYYAKRKFSPHFDGWKLKLHKYIIQSEIPIETMEEATGTPFRKMWSEQNDERHKKSKEREEFLIDPWYIQ